MTEETKSKKKVLTSDQKIFKKYNELLKLIKQEIPNRSHGQKIAMDNIGQSITFILNTIVRSD